MKLSTVRKLIASIVAAAQVSTAIAAPSFYLVVPVPSSASSTVGGLQVSPGSLTFVGTELGATAEQAVAIQNTGKIAQSSPLIEIVANQAEYAVRSDCPAVLEPGKSCAATVKYSPDQDTGLGQLRVSFSPVGDRYVSLSGVSLFDDLEGSKNLDFGFVQPGQTAVVSATLSNQGTRTADLSYSTLPPTVTQSGTCGATLAPKASCDLTFSFKALSADDRTPLDFVFRTQAENSGAEFRLTAQPLAASNITGGGAFDYGTLVLGSSLGKTFTLNNSGDVAGDLTASALPAGISRSGTCGATLPAGQSCDVTFTWTPVSAGVLNTTVALGNVLFSLSGTAQSQAMLASTGSTAFGTVLVGESAAKTLTLTNSGNQSSSVVYGELPADVVKSGTCSGTLAGGANCTVILTWTPTASGNLTANYLITGTNNSLTLALSGAAQTKAALSSAGDTAFGTVYVGDTAAKTVTVTNDGQQSTSLAYGTLPSGVTKSGTCATTLAGGASCTVILTWAPAASGNLSANYTITGTNDSLTLALSGAAQTKAALSSTGSTAFGTVYVGDTAAKTVTVTNGGQQSTSLAYGTLPSGVTKSGTCATTLAGGASCTVILTWAPSASGNLSANYTITGTNDSVTLALSGTAQTKAVLSSTGDTAFGTVEVGDTASKTVTVTNGGQQASSLAYGTLPAGVTKSGTCSGTLAGGASCTVILTWAPSASGSLSANYTITGTNNSLTLALSGSSITAASLSGGSSQAYGTVLVGNSAAKTWTIANSGQATASLTYGTLPTNVTKSGTCSTTLAGGASCTVILTWAPTAAGTLNATYTVGTQTLTLTGTAAAQAPAATLSPTSYDFGSIVVGQSDTTTVDITNTGNVALTLPANVGTATAPYSVTDTCGTSLAVGASCTATVTYSPTVSGTHNSSVTINAGGAGNKAFTVTGVGLTPASLSGGSSQAYGTVVVGSSAAKTWTIANNGQATASLTYGTLPTNVTKSGTCSSSLAGGASCTVILTWAPTAATTLNATYTVGTQTLTLTGTAAAQAPAATLSATSNAFGSVVVGQSDAVTFDITNTGNVTLTLPANVGTATAPYSVTDVCGTSLAVGASCTVTVTYSPTAAGTHNSSVTINTGGAGTKTFTVTGTGITAASLSGGGSKAYGTVVVGSSAANTWTISNSGQATASLTYGTLPTNVTKSGTCSTTLAGGTSCTVILTWAPTAATTLNATYTVGTQTLTLTGTAAAQAPAATLSPTSYDFGSIVVGQSDTTTVSLTNTGNVALTLPANVGTATAPYSVTDTCGTSLAVGASCTATVTYNPTVAGSHNSSVTINAGGAGNKAFTVTGDGITAASLSGGGSQAYGTVVVGSSAAKTWTISNSGQATASLTYGTLPTNVTKSGTCSTTLAGGTSCTVILTWAPTAATTVNATYTVGTQTLTLTGTAVAQAPAATLSKTSNAFGSIVVGQSASTTVDITNTGNVTLTLPTNVGTATAPYSVTDACGTSLAVGAICTVTITYSPTAAAAHNSSVTINTGAAGNKTVTVTGTGITAASLSKSGDAAFGTVSVGGSGSKTITVSNTGQQSSSLAYGTLPTGVTKSGTCSTSLAGGASCTVILSWAPTAAGTLSANYTVTGTNNSVTITLSGTAATGPTVVPATYTVGRTYEFDDFGWEYWYTESYVPFTVSNGTVTSVTYAGGYNGPNIYNVEMMWGVNGSTLYVLFGPGPGDDTPCNPLNTSNITLNVVTTTGTKQVSTTFKEGCGANSVDTAKLVYPTVSKWTGIYP